MSENFKVPMFEEFDMKPIENLMDDEIEKLNKIKDTEPETDIEIESETDIDEPETESNIEADIDAAMQLYLDLRDRLGEIQDTIENSPKEAWVALHNHMTEMYNETPSDQFDELDELVLQFLTKKIG